MERNKIIIIVMVIIIIALCALIGGFFMMNSQKDDVVIFNNTIDDIGTFNSTNVTNFTLSNRSNDLQTDYIANDTIAQVTVTSSSSAIEVTTSNAEKVNDSAEGHTIYKDTANVGEHKGDVRYFSILTDNEKSRYIMISTADHNLTGMMVDSFVMF